MMAFGFAARLTSCEAVMLLEWAALCRTVRRQLLIKEQKRLIDSHYANYYISAMLAFIEGGDSCLLRRKIYDFFA